MYARISARFNSNGIFFNPVRASVCNISMPHV